MSGLATLKQTPGLTAFLDELEERLAAIVGRGEGVVATIGVEALASGGKRLRPALCFLSAPLDSPPPFAAAAAVELLHMATLVHDDVLDAAELRRGRASAWATHGPAAALARWRQPVRARVRRARRDRRRRGSSDPRGGCGRPRARRGDAAAAAARPRHAGGCVPRAVRAQDGDACSRRPACSPRGTSVSAPSGSRSASPSRSRTTSSTAPVSRRRPERSPEPTCATARRRSRCILAAREDAVVRDALAGGPLDGALLRVGATGALERIARGRARLRAAGAGAPRRRGARGRARGPDPSRGRSERLTRWRCCRRSRRCPSRMRPRPSPSTATGSGSRCSTTTAASPCSRATRRSCTSGRPATRAGASATRSTSPSRSGAESFIAGTASCRIRVDGRRRALRGAARRRRSPSGVARRRLRRGLRRARVRHARPGRQPRHLLRVGGA